MSDLERLRQRMLGVLMLTTLGVGVAFLLAFTGCKKKGASHEPPPEDIWVGTGGVALVCGDEEDRISTCVGKGQVWTCVQEGWAHPRYHCAPRHQQAEQP